MNLFNKWIEVKSAHGHRYYYIFSLPTRETTFPYYAILRKVGKESKSILTRVTTIENMQKIGLVRVLDLEIAKNFTKQSTRLRKKLIKEAFREYK